MRNFECLLWDPILALSLEVLEAEVTLIDPSVALLELLRLVDIRAWVHVSDIVFLCIKCELSESREFFGICEHLNEALIICLVVLYLEESSAFAFSRHHHLVHLASGCFQLALQTLNLFSLPLLHSLILAQMSAFYVVNDVHLGELRLPRAYLP